MALIITVVFFVTVVELALALFSLAAVSLGTGVLVPKERQTYEKFMHALPSSIPVMQIIESQVSRLHTKHSDIWKVTKQKTPSKGGR